MKRCVFAHYLSAYQECLQVAVARLYKLYFLHILPAIGGMISGNRGAYRYLPASVLHFPAPDRFMKMMQDAGFKEVKHKAFTLGVCRMYVGIK